MKGKICVVTGANSGIGRETAVGLARLGATVVMVCRNAARGEAAQRAIIAQSHNRDVHLLLGDLSNQAQIRNVAAEIKRRFPRLDVLVNNAGQFLRERLLTVDGLEMTFALNHLGYFLLTAELLDILLASTPSRVVNVSSGAHAGGRIRFDNLQGERRYSGWTAYSRSKLANVMFTYELARRLESSGVTANVLHPGFVSTNFGRGSSLLMNGLMVLARPFALTPEEGAETPVYLASSPEVDGVTGAYFYRKRPQRSSTRSYNEAKARKLWQVSAELTKVSPDYVASLREKT